MSAPKPEMLEKADKTVAEFELRFPRAFNRSRSTVQERDALVYLIADDTQEALRASEASVESLKAKNRALAEAVQTWQGLEHAARAEATKAEDALRKIRDLHTRDAGYSFPVCISCDGEQKWPCETDRIAGEALAAIRAPRQPEHGSPSPSGCCQCGVDHVAARPPSPTPPTSGCVYVLSDGSVCGRSYESDAHSPILSGHPFHPVPTPPIEEPR